MPTLANTDKFTFKLGNGNERVIITREAADAPPGTPHHITMERYPQVKELRDAISSAAAALGINEQEIVHKLGKGERVAW